MKITAAFVIAAMFAATPVWALNVTEAIDFSSSGLAPTAFTLDAGTNIFSGTTGNTGVTDRDYIALTVQPGFVLSSLVLGPGTSVGGAFSFLGAQAGPVMTVPPSTPDASGLIGYAHYGTADIGFDLLPIVAFARDGSSGLATPFAAGTYTFWVQDFSAGVYAYEFQFGVTPVPEPGTYAMMIAGLGALAIARRRQNRHRSIAGMATN